MDEGIKPPKIQRRARIEVLVKILEHLKRVPSRKTQLLNSCNLNYMAMMRYLYGLMRGGYITEHSLAPKRGSFYTLTEAGEEALIRLNESIDFVDLVMA